MGGRAIVHEWICLKCDAEGLGDADTIDKAAEKHTKDTTHPTYTRIAHGEDDAE